MISSSRFKKFIATLLFMLPIMTPVAASAFEPLGPGCEGAPSSAVCADPGIGSNPVNETLITAINLLSIVGGIIAVIIIIIAGINMTLSSGDSGKVTSSRNSIIYALVGAVVIVLARSIVIFVITKVG